MSASFRGLLAIAAIAALLATSACTVKPLLASDPADSLGTASVGSKLASVAVAPVDTRYAQQVRNNLIFLMRGGAAEPSTPRYRLTLVVRQVSRDAASIQRVDEEQPTAKLMTLTAAYSLVDVAAGKTITTGRREVSSPYDVPRQEYAVYRAEIDAQDRAARELAEVLRLTVAQALERADVRG